MRHRLIRSTCTGLAALACASAGAAAFDMPTSASWLTAGSLLLTLGAVAALLASNRSLRRELDRSGLEREQEHNSRVHVELKLRVISEELERETVSKREELDGFQRQLAQVRDQLAEAEGRLNRFARIDEVTGVANRARFDEAVDQEIKRTIRDKAPLSLLICEIDFFDEYARRRDDARRDETLARVARAIDDVFRRAGDLVARIGDARIGVVQPATDSETAARFGERVRKCVWDLCIPHEASQAAERMTISVGVATMLPSRLHRASELAEAAEAALRKAHESGHNRMEKGLVA